MKISIKYEVLDKALNTLLPVATDKLLADNLKNVTLHIKEDVSKLIAVNTQITSAVDVSVICEGFDEVMPNEEGVREEFVQFKANELKDILATFKGLQRTKVSKVVIIPDLNHSVLEIHEEPADSDIPNADKYKRVTKFKVARLQVRSIFLKDIRSVEKAPEVDVEVESCDLSLYINSLLPLINADKRESFNSIYLSPKYIYATLPSYIALLPNDFKDAFEEKGIIIECLEGFKLQNNKASFLKTFISDVEKVGITKTINERGGVIFTVVKEGALASIKCPDLTKVRDITNDVEALNDVPYVKIDKVYLLDVLKRVKLTSDVINVHVNTESGLMTLNSKTMKLDVPILAVEGLEGVYSFQLKADIVGSLVFAHTNDFSDVVHIGFKEENNSVTMVCNDEIAMWKTIIKGLPKNTLNAEW